jgi:hypothetical protein
MKTMLELLVRLDEMRCHCERARRNSQLTAREKAMACAHKQIVRECLPSVVLVHYDRMNGVERALLPSPVVFAMSVLVSTYRSLPPRQRRKLVTHFATTSPTRSNAVQRSGTARRSRRITHRIKATTKNVAGER